jgi:hypothetical protein
MEDYFIYICIRSERTFRPITVGKSYKVKLFWDLGTKIFTYVGDDGKEYLFNSGNDYFIPLNEFREKRLSELGI